MSIAELESNVAAESSIDVVTTAVALHWFDLPNFYQQVKWALKKPHGVVAAWTYFTPEINGLVDAVAQRYYNTVEPYFEPAIKLAKDKYRSIHFPFEPVDGLNDTGPFQFVIEKLMNLDLYLTYLRSWSGYQTAREKGLELSSDEVVEDFKRAWSTEDGQDEKAAKFQISSRIGRVGNV
jgi:hypothetical protein